jgi:hypothetical protein
MIDYFVLMFITHGNHNYLIISEICPACTETFEKVRSSNAQVPADMAQVLVICLRAGCPCEASTQQDLRSEILAQHYKAQGKK